MAVSKVGPTGLTSAVGQLGKNVVENGAMQIDQRSGDTRTGKGANADYLCDRWKFITRSSAPCRFTYSVEASGGVNGVSYWSKFLVTTADTTLASGDASSMVQPLVGHDVQALIGSNGKFGGGVLSADVFFTKGGGSSLSFPIKACMGIKTLDGTARQFHEDVTITTESTWQRVSIYIPADGTAQIDNNAAEAARLHFGFMSNQKATDATWENNDIDHYTTSSTDNLVDATDNVFGITNIQFEPGGVATDFEHEPVSVTLAKCLRYFWRWKIQDANSQLFAAPTMNSTTNAFFGPVNMPVEMRAAPTGSISDVGHVVVADGGNGNRAVSNVAFHPNKNAATIHFTVAEGTVGGAYAYRDGPADALFFDFTAEL
tara:strand:- start:245 stop:1363 length:1119 start_codon:yes stop_codon:yes gene_type:complete